jgi:hypothetical protein
MSDGAGGSSRRITFALRVVCVCPHHVNTSAAQALCGAATTHLRLLPWPPLHVAAPPPPPPQPPHRPLLQQRRLLAADSPAISASRIPPFCLARMQHKRTHIAFVHMAQKKDGAPECTPGTRVAV